MVVAADVEHLVASSSVLRVANACDPMANLPEVGQLLGIQMKEVAWSLMFVAVRRLFLPEGGPPSDPGLPKPHTHRGPGHV
jgi:hypothetical protein